MVESSSGGVIGGERKGRVLLDGGYGIEVGRVELVKKKIGKG